MVIASLVKEFQLASELNHMKGIVPDDILEALKNKIMNNIERYFYLIVFAMYVREAGPKEFPQTFKEWMDQHGSLRDMIAEGRGKLEWERKIPDEKLVDLKEMLAS